MRRVQAGSLFAAAGVAVLALSSCLGGYGVDGNSLRLETTGELLSQRHDGSPSEDPGPRLWSSVDRSLPNVPAGISTPEPQPDALGLVVEVAPTDEVASSEEGLQASSTNTLLADQGGPDQPDPTVPEAAAPEADGEPAPTVASTDRPPSPTTTPSSSATVPSSFAPGAGPSARPPSPRPTVPPIIFPPSTLPPSTVAPPTVPPSTAPPVTEPTQGSTDAGPLLYDYATDRGGRGDFYSDRDCGWSTPVAGYDGDGNPVSRAFWAFCDSVGYEPDTGELWSLAGVPSNSYGIAAAGSNPAQSPSISPSSADHTGAPVLLTELLPGLDDSCDDPDLPYPREWVRGMVTLPDNDPSTETILVFYQNFCIDFRDAVGFGAGGVAAITWDARRPDAPIQREKLNDRWFLPAMLTDQRSGQTYRSYSYGSGPVVATVDGRTWVYTYLCGAGGDCTVARAPISADRPGLDNARALATTSAWRYRAENGSWVAFGEPSNFGTCVPTEHVNCGGLPRPMVVAEADRRDLLTTPAAEPSVKQVGNRWYLLYSAGLDDGQFAYRVATDPGGPYSEPRLVPLGPGLCPVDCRAPYWQPSFDRDGKWAISYYDEHALDGLVDLDRDRGGRLMVAYIDPADLPPIGN